MLTVATAMLLRGVALRIVVLVLGLAVTTLRRYAARSAASEPLVQPRGPAPCKILDAKLVDGVTAVVKETRGQMGAVALAKRTGGSRRSCARIKAMALTKMEHDRKKRAFSVRVRAPGIMRSFDQLHIRVDGIKKLLLICADACIPFRTTIALVDRYTTENVARVIAADIARFGAPLIWRMDRAKSHMTALVMELLARHGVIPLFGPPRHPGFYGQMERMNLEHRRWLLLGPILTACNIGYEISEMRRVLNDVIIRPTLGYVSASELWGQRPPIHVDRDELRREIVTMTAHRYFNQEDEKDAMLRSMRQAIETAITNREFVTIERGSWC
jgi:transposase InsO family protein